MKSSPTALHYEEKPDFTHKDTVTETTSRQSSNTSTPNILDQVRNAVRVRHYSIRTEHTYVEWTQRFIAFNNYQDPMKLDAQHVSSFLSHLATHANVAAATHRVKGFAPRGQFQGGQSCFSYMSCTL
jgi:hypothetical protein